MKKRFLICLTGFFILIPFGISSETTFFDEPKDSKILRVVREIANSSKYCILISTDRSGFPGARMMDPFPPEPRWTIWMGTNVNSKKVEEVKRNNKVSVYYESPGGDGYLILKGLAYIIDDSDKKTKYFKKEWELFYPAGRENFILIKFTAIELEVVSYKNGLIGEERTWAAPSVKFKQH